MRLYGTVSAPGNRLIAAYWRAGIGRWSGGAIKGPDRTAHSLVHFFRQCDGAQGASVDEEDLAGDRLERRPEMLHRLDADGRITGRIDTKRGELRQVDGLAVIADHDDVDAADAKHHRRPVIAFEPAAHRAVGNEFAVA